MISSKRKTIALAAALVVAGMLPGGPGVAGADDGDGLAAQVRLLTAKVARLESAVAKIAPPPPPATVPGPAGGAGAPAPGPAGGMGGMMSMMSGMAGPAGGPLAAATPVPLPGFPGLPGVYHFGAADFFLSSATLSAEQAGRLEQLRQRAATEQASAAQAVEEAERQIYTLTAADQPDATAIEATVRRVERIRGDQRLAFIRLVGEAARVLTDDQRRSLAATMTPAEHAAHHQSKP
jgi:outer membrane murein-binding lipoprotein Lpp